MGLSYVEYPTSRSSHPHRPARTGTNNHQFLANCNTESARRGGYNVLVEELYPKQLGFQGLVQDTHAAYFQKDIIIYGCCFPGLDMVIISSARNVNFYVRIPSTNQQTQLCGWLCTFKRASKDDLLTAYGHGGHMERA